jgi:molybdopterin synthase catalytic subunit
MPDRQSDERQNVNPPDQHRQPMIREVSIVNAPIDEGELLGRRRPGSSAGAILYFLGVVRDTERGESIDAIEYESFEKMARHQFDLILNQIEARWPIESVRLVHRIGVVEAGHPSLWVEVKAPHRGEAFAACQYLIDEMKRIVPIWKRPIPTSA